MKLRNLTIEHLWVFGALGTCFGYACLLPMEQTDSWHYIKTGGIMLHSHRILDRDLFSFTVPNQPYVNMHWASHIPYYLLYRAGGVPLLVFGHAALLTSAFVLLFRILWDQSRNLRVASLVIFLTFLLTAPDFTLRPQGFSILFFVLTMYWLRRGRLWAIPPLLLVWANFHGAFVLGLILVGLEWLGRLKWFGGPSRGAAALFITGALAALATLINPWGFRLYPALLENEALCRISQIVEWDPPSIFEPTGALFFGAWLLLVILRNVSAYRWRRIEVLTLLVFTVMALRQQRAVMWWAIAIAPLFSETIQGLSLVKEYRPPQAHHLWVINWVLALALGFYLIGCLPWIKEKNPLIPASKRPLLVADTPLELARQLRNTPPAHRIFNNFLWGSYFIWALRDDQKVFHDPRTYVFTEAVIEDYLRVTRGYATWEDILRRYQVDTLALSRADQALLIPLVQASKNWKPIYEDKQGLIFLKAGVAFE